MAPMSARSYSTHVCKVTYLAPNLLEGALTVKGDGLQAFVVVIPLVQ